MELCASYKSMELNDLSINLFRTKCLITLDDEIIEIRISVDDQIFENLKQTIIKMSNVNWKVNFYEESRKTLYTLNFQRLTEQAQLTKGLLSEGQLGFKTVQFFNQTSLY